MANKHLEITNSTEKRSVHIYCCVQVRKSSICTEEKKKEKKFGILRKNKKVFTLLSKRCF